MQPALADGLHCLCNAVMLLDGGAERGDAHQADKAEQRADKGNDGGDIEVYLRHTEGCAGGLGHTDLGHFEAGALFPAVGNFVFGGVLAVDDAVLVFFEGFGVQ